MAPWEPGGSGLSTTSRVGPSQPAKTQRPPSTPGPTNEVAKEGDWMILFWGTATLSAVNYFLHQCWLACGVDKAWSLGNCWMFTVYRKPWNFLHISFKIVSSLCWRWRGLRLPDTEWEDRVQTIHFSILKVTWHLFVGEDVVEFWQMSAFLPGCCRKHIWKAWLMFPNNHRLLLIWWKTKVCVFTCWFQGLLAISFKMM